MKQVVGELAFPVGGAEAEHVGVRDGARTQAGAENVPIDANDACHGAAVRVQCRGRIVCFCFHADAPRVVPSDDAGIVVKHRKQPVNLLLHVVGGLHDVRLEQ